jgi:hypothetical protein
VLYGQDYASAARRHLKAAQVLHETSSPGAQPGCQAVAGYLFGICGELAIKEMMRQSGMKPLHPEERRDDPFYAHFPELKTRLRDSNRGRRSGALDRLAKDPTLFQYWDTEMRYASTAEIRVEWVSKWKETAERLVDQMELG